MYAIHWIDDQGRNYSADETHPRSAASLISSIMRDALLCVREVIIDDVREAYSLGQYSHGVTLFEYEHEKFAFRDRDLSPASITVRSRPLHLPLVLDGSDHDPLHIEGE